MSASTAPRRSAHTERGWGPPPLYEKLVPAPHQIAHEEVAAIQRERLCGAMMQAVAEHGYGKVTVSRLHRLAGVSKHTPYDRFGRTDAKRECLLAAIEAMLAISIERARAAQRRGCEWRERLALTLGSLARDVVRHPDAARVVLLEAFDPNAGALAALVNAGERLEELLACCFEDVPGGEDPPPLIVKGILAGSAHVARAHLLAGREPQLPRLAAGELAAWACACCAQAPLPAAPDAAESSAAIEAWTPAPALGTQHDANVCEERLWMLEACGRLAAEGGYDSLRISAIEKEAHLPRGTFLRQFTGVRECFVGAYEALCGDALTRALSTTHRGRPRVMGTHPVLTRLAGQIAARPDLARIAFCELVAAGPAGVCAQTRLLEGFAHELACQTQPGRRPSPVALSAGVAAVWGVAGHLAACGGAQRLPAKAQLLTRLMPPVHRRQPDA